MSHIPNILTLIRIGLVPVLIVLLNHQAYNLALVVFVIAGISDGLDGYLAKRFGWVTAFGSVLDPLADKFLLLSSFVMLTIAGALPFWLLVLVAFRDMVIITGVVLMTLLYDHFEMKPILSSKINTFLQLLLICMVLLEHAMSLNPGLLLQVMIWVAALSTLISGTQYVYEWGFKPQDWKSTEK